MLDTLRRQFSDVNGRLLFVGAYASLGSVSQGFDSAWWGFIIGAKAFNDHYGSEVVVAADGSISHTLTTSEVSIGTGLGLAFGMIGSVLISYPMKHWGRKICLWFIAITLLLGVVIEAVSTIPASYACLIVGKCLVSLGTGLSAGSICAYLCECSPPSIRGTIITVYTNIQTFGGLTGAICVYCVVDRTDEGCWLYPICLQALFPAIFLAGIFFLPESPRWLISMGRVEQAEKVVRSLRNWDNERVHEEVIEMAFACEEEARMDASFGWTDLFKGTNRKRTLISIGAQTLQQAQGLVYIISYLVLTLISLGFSKSQLINLIMFVIQFVCTATSFYAADRFGRRALLLVGSIVMFCCMIIISSIVTYQPTPKGHLADTTLAMYLLWMFTMMSTWFPISFILGSEAPAQGLRDKTLSISMWWGYAVALVIIMVGPYVTNPGYGDIGAKINYVWAVVSLGAVAWVYFMVPELKGRSLEEIDYMFEREVPIRKFRTLDTSTMLQEKHTQAVKEGFNNVNIASAVLTHRHNLHVGVDDDIEIEAAQRTQPGRESKTGSTHVEDVEVRNNN